MGAVGYIYVCACVFHLIYLLFWFKHLTFDTISVQQVSVIDPPLASGSISMVPAYVKINYKIGAALLQSCAPQKPMLY